MENKEKVLEQLEEARLKKQQCEHQIQILQSISKEADSLTRVEFYDLMERVFALPAVCDLVEAAVQKHEAGGG